MVNRSATVATLVVLLLTPAVSPFTVRSFAQMAASCSREMARQDAALRQFDAEARRASADFLVDDVARTALDGMKSNLAGDPTAEALQESRDAYDQWREFIDTGKSHMEMMADLARCLSVSGASGCLNEIIARNVESSRLLGRVSDATNEWIKSLANDTISKAAERVEKARSITETLVTRAGNLAIGATNGALDNCFRDMEQRVARSNQTVDLTSTPPTPPTPQPPQAAGNTGASAAASGGGMSAGAIAGVTAAGAAGGVGLWYLSEAQKKAQCDALETEAYNKVNGLINSVNNLSGCGTSTSCFNTRISAVNSAFSSFNSAIGNWCTCLGPSATAELTAADKAMVRDMFSQMRSIGVNPGTLPACFR